MTSIYSINYSIRQHKRDPFIEFIKSMLMSPFVLHSKPYNLDIMDNSNSEAGRNTTQIDRYSTILNSEHIEKNICGLSDHSRLKRLVPTIGMFFTNLPLMKSFLVYDKTHCLSERRFVPPSFNDIRKYLRKYADGKDFDKDNELINLLIQILEQDIYIAIVTAAAYGDDEELYEKRLSGLLHAFEHSNLTDAQKTNFFVLGGECNYLFRLNKHCKLKYSSAPPKLFDSDEDQMNSLMDAAESNLRNYVTKLKLTDTKIIRKSHSVGLVKINPHCNIEREKLDECVLSTQFIVKEMQQKLLNQSKQILPFCAFNGGSDAWFDIGNKLIGVKMLQKLLNTKPEHTLHVGDQFLSTGNDFATRSACCTIWICNPTETHDILEHLVKLLNWQLVEFQ